MKGVLAFRPRRLRRAAVLAGVTALVGAGTVLGGAQAHAAVPTKVLGNGNDTLGVNPAAAGSPTNPAATDTPITVTSPDKCPTINPGGGAQIRLVKPTDTTRTSTLGTATSINATVPFTATLSPGSLSTAVGILGIAGGDTAELVVECFPNGPLAGGGVFEDDAFLKFSADLTTYTAVPNPLTGGTQPTSVSVGLTASPSTATSGQSVTLTATTTPSNATGTIQFMNNGTAINSPVTVSGGTATTTFTAPTVTAAETEALTAVYTPTDPTQFTPATGTASLPVNPAGGGGGNSGTVPLAVTVPTGSGGGGSFTLTVDTATTVNLTTSGSSATGSTTPITVADTRTTPPGWSVSGQDADWTGAGGSFSGNQLGWKPTDTALATGAVLGGTVAPVSPGIGTTAATLASAPAGSGAGTSTLGADLTLAIPATAAPGSYTSGLTISAVTSAP